MIHSQSETNYLLDTMFTLLFISFLISNQDLIGSLDYHRPEFKTNLLKCLITTRSYLKPTNHPLFQKDESFYQSLLHNLEQNYCDNILCSTVLALSYADFNRVSTLFPTISSTVVTILNRSSLASVIIQNTEENLDNQKKQVIQLPGLIQIFLRILPKNKDDSFKLNCMKDLSILLESKQFQP